jgi:hypothetical protein
MQWPKDTPQALNAFYGKHVLKTDGQPTEAWLGEHLKLFPAPYPLALSWSPAEQAKKIRCHKLVGESLIRIFEQILAHYGSYTNVKGARMHLYAGCYNFRIIKDSTRLSTHAWGAGIDLDPEKNPLGKQYDENAGMMPEPVIEIFEAEGWKWGGRFIQRPDCMHFQATV